MKFKGNNMKTEYEIRDRINSLISEMHKINDTDAGDLFTHMSDVKKSVANYNELETIHWLIDEPLPQIVEELKSYYKGNKYD